MWRVLWSRVMRQSCQRTVLAPLNFFHMVWKSASELAAQLSNGYDKIAAVERPIRSAQQIGCEDNGASYVRIYNHPWNTRIMPPEIRYIGDSEERPFRGGRELLA